MQSLKLTKADRISLVQRYFDEYNFVQSNIESFDTFVEWRLQKLIDEIGTAVPAVIPPEAEEVKLVFGKIRVEKPAIIEADGAKRKILPVEARTRLLTYAAPVYLEVSLMIDGKERERQEVQICELPVMLKSRLCYLHNLPREERIVAGEDPYDTGGYFIINGTERTLILLEDLAANNIFVAKDKGGPITHKANVYSASEQYKIPHIVERTKEGTYLLSFAGNKRVPLFAVLKALGISKDAEVSKLINMPEVDEDVFINLMTHVDLRTENAAQDFIGKELGMVLPPEQRAERIQHILDNFLLPHVGSKPENRLAKARYLGRIVKKLILFKQKKIKKDVKDHYMNKRVRLSGDLLEDLFRNNLKILVNDMLYIFQRGVRRGKILSITSIVRTKFLSDRIKSALATGNWTANRQGISQRLDRENALASLAHLQRVSSLLEASRESFEARELHPTHWGRLCPLESPEGKHIGLRKNLALLATVTPELKKDEVEENFRMLEQLGLKKFTETDNSEQKLSDVFFDGRLVGQVESPTQFVAAIRQARRENRLSRFFNVSYIKKTDTVYTVLERNRVVRPLLVVKDGALVITEDKIKAMNEGSIRWSDLVKEGAIEYLDALEEEDTLVALNEADITPKHTHMEINPVAIFSMTTSMVPYANFNQASKLGKGHKTQKQAMGCYTLSFQNRMDTTVNLLHYPQKPITRSFTQRLLGEELSPGQNVVVAVINWDGYNMKDAVVVNKASIERGLGRSSHFRPYVTEKLRYPGGQIDEIVSPGKDISGYTIEKDYRFLTDDGIVYPEAEVAGGDVVIGKTSPPRFLGKLEAFSTAANIRKDASVRVRYGEGGIVNKVIITESEEGSQLIKVEVREDRKPEIGDKLSSKHGQKGVIGLIVPAEDIPFSTSGIVPDILFSPNGLPRRLTAGHIIEALSGKVGALAGRYIDGTPFLCEEAPDLRNELLNLGFIENGTETLYDGRTGKEYHAKIFVGNMYYLRLKHQVADKIQVRARGPVTLLTRQPTEGKAKEGGLRLGEMEKDCFVAHGAALLMKERFDSDRTVVWVCEHCGNLAIYDAYKSKAYCLCGEKVRISPIEMSYAFKLFLDELKSMHIKPRLILKEKY